MSKYVLLVERVNSELNSSSVDKYCLEGVFTEFNKKNKNGRIYQSEEMMPHIEILQEKIKSRRLLGELDHPQSFDISLKNASHIIEELRFDKEKNQVIGKIRLLNTDAGKQAQALVDAGVPLHISSRAAGLVESNSNVKIKKLFTYDLVADPGFENAELKLVNESFGLEDDDLLRIYELPESASFELEEEDKKNNTQMEDVTQFINKSDFNEYTKYVKTKIDEINTNFNELNESIKNNKIDINSNDNVTNEKLIEYVKYLAENLDNAISHNNYLVEESNKRWGYQKYINENVDNLISHNDYIIENMKNDRSYAKYLAENLDNVISYNDYLTEEYNKRWKYQNYVNENLDNVISHNNYLVEESNKRWGYQKYINENVDNLISHNDYIVEGLSSVAGYADYLKENTQNLINYFDNVVEGVNENFNKINKGGNIVTNVNENNTSNLNDFKNSINSKLDAILENAKTEPVIKETPFYDFLSHVNRVTFNEMNKEDKDNIINIFENSKYYGTVDVNNIFENNVSKKVKGVKLDWLENMPLEYIPTWNALNESQKNSIKLQASIRSLETQYQIDNFWQTRDLRPSKVDLVNESKIEIESTNTSYKTPDVYMDSVMEGLKRRFNK